MCLWVVGVTNVCKRSTPPSAFPPWAVTWRELPVLVPADRRREKSKNRGKNARVCVLAWRWEREGAREREENKRHHLAGSHHYWILLFFSFGGEISSFLFISFIRPFRSSNLKIDGLFRPGDFSPPILHIRLILIIFLSLSARDYSQPLSFMLLLLLFSAAIRRDFLFGFILCDLSSWQPNWTGFISKRSKRTWISAALFVSRGKQWQQLLRNELNLLTMLPFWT